MNLRLDEPAYGSEAEELAMDELMAECTDFVIAAVRNGQLSLAHGWREDVDPATLPLRNPDSSSSSRNAENPTDNDTPTDRNNDNNNNAFSNIRVPFVGAGVRRPRVRDSRLSTASLRAGSISRADGGKSLFDAGREYVGKQFRAGRLFFGGGGGSRSVNWAPNARLAASRRGSGLRSSTTPVLRWFSKPAVLRMGR
jgi:hypothetical protein